MANFTDLPKIAICSSDIDSETLEAIWIVYSLAATAALAAIVGWVRTRRRLSPRGETETKFENYVTFHPSVYRYRGRSHVLWKDSFRVYTDRQFIVVDISSNSLTNIPTQNFTRVFRISRTLTVKNLRW